MNQAVNNLSRKGQWQAFLICGTVSLVHVIALALLFTPLSGLFDSRPLIDQDWGLHSHHLNSLAAFWGRDKMFWGYNPYFMAGFPSNTIQDLSIKFFEFVALAMSFIAGSPIQWFKMIAFLSMASVPWFMYLTTCNFFFGNDAKHFVATSATVLGTVYWWNSLPREMFFYGMLGFPIASYLSILGVSLFYKLAADPEKFRWAHFAWLVFAAAILPLHVQSIVIFLPPVILLLVIKPRLVTKQLLAWSAAGAAVAFLANSAWLIPAYKHRTDDVSGAIVGQLPLFASTNPFTFFLDYFGPHGYWTFRPSFMEKGLRIVLLLLGSIGLWKLIHSDKRPVGIILAGTSVVLFAVTYFGALIPLTSAWQPLRFKVPLDLMLALGASYGISEWYHAPKSARSPFLPVAVGLGLMTFLLNVAETEGSGQLQLRSQFVPELSALVDWIKRDTPSDARILFEESGDESGFVYDRSYLSSFLPALTGRQIIGGPINLYNDRHHFAEFHSGRMFKKAAPALSDEEVKNYLSLYNVGAIVAFDPRMIERLRRLPGLVTVEQRIGPIHLMRVHQPLSWFVEGEGKVEASFNRLELSELKGKEIVLKYHWIDGLSTTPPVKTAAVKLMDDPIPFIKLIDPPANVTLRVGSKASE